MSNPMQVHKIQGYVFNIQRYSVHDGEGIRTNVFLKGCPLRCRWCSNPESQELKPELARNEQRCLGVEKCDFCAAACKHDALGLPETGMPVVLREKCQRCMACAACCPTGALTPFGSLMSVEEVIRNVEKDSIFYSRSGGGMTLSGGEPLLQSEFAMALLREAKRRRIHSAVETCGQVPWEVYEEACVLLNEMLFDIKLIDPEKHKLHTGTNNRLILNNIRGILENFPSLKVCVRTPVIPGVNDSPEDIAAILNFLAPYPAAHYELLPYHRLGTQKYFFLDREYPMGETALDVALMEELARMAALRRAS